MFVRAHWSCASDGAEKRNFPIERVQVILPHAVGIARLSICDEPGKRRVGSVFPLHLVPRRVRLEPAACYTP